MTTPRVQLGDIVEDTVTGFKGTVVARTEWLNGCWRIVIQPKGLNKDGKTFDAETYDELQLKVIKPKAPAVGVGNKSTGGPRPKEVKHASATRI